MLFPAWDTFLRNKTLPIAAEAATHAWTRAMFLTQIDTSAPPTLGHGMFAGPSSNLETAPGNVILTNVYRDLGTQTVTSRVAATFPSAEHRFIKIADAGVGVGSN